MKRTVGLLGGVLLAIPGAANAAPARSETAVLAGGCFWGMESVFEHVKGVSDVVSGYAGGSAQTAHYDDADSGHASGGERRVIGAGVVYCDDLVWRSCLGTDGMETSREEQCFVVRADNDGNRQNSQHTVGT